MGEWGIDQPLADVIHERQLGRTYHVTEGWQQTQEILNTDIII